MIDSRGKGLRCFRWAVRRLILIHRVCRVFVCRGNYLMWSNVLSISNQSAERDKKIAFDVNYFKVKEDRVPIKLEAIMRKVPESRTEDDVSLLCNMMSSVASFCRYSQTLRLLLARVVRYQRLDSHRLVIKKGHTGDSFYFVFSGVLAVTSDKDGGSAFVAKNPILIKKGMGFGDVALLKGLRRNATVVCVEETQLLVIDKEDFYANKMDQELKKEFEHRFSFFRSLFLVSSWSASLIEQMTEHSKTEQFPFGEVIVRDTSEIENIIFISKGQCDVLRMVDLTSCSAFQHAVRRNTGSPQRAHMPQLQMDQDRKQVPPQSRVLPSDQPTPVCFLIESLDQGSTFGLSEYLLPPNERDKRGYCLFSHNVELIRVEKKRFVELVDESTLQKLEALQKSYPSDEDLCRIFLEHERWQEYKRGVVQDVLTHKVHRKSIGSSALHHARLPQRQSSRRPTIPKRGN